MKAAAVVLAVLLLLSGWHVRLQLAPGVPVAVPLPVLALLAELAVCAVLGWLIARVAGWRPPYSRRTA
jgi:hypothetical protein